MSEFATKQLDQAGDVDIQELTIISSKGTFLDVRDYLSELNLYEDIFSPSLYGNLLLSDSRNLIKELPIIGDEYLVVKFKTPTIEAPIEKTFRIYSVTDRKVANDLNTQVYLLHFISKESVIDTVKPLYRSFEGKVDEVVSEIWETYFQSNRTVKVEEDKINLFDNKTKLVIINEPKNKVKYVSPGWTPFKNINFCASKALPSHGEACNYLFFESSKNFYFTNIENIFEANNNTSNSPINLGRYFFKVSDVEKKESAVSKLFQVQNFRVKKTVDHLSNYDNGYLSNRLITLDFINKDYRAHDYDIVERFSNYVHSQGERSIPLFSRDTVRTPLSKIKFYPQHPGLHTSVSNNINEVMPEIYGNRLSNLLELSNFKVIIDVPGRTDAEVGCMLNFVYPDISPRDDRDSSKVNDDVYYSGNYLVTAIRHKINLLSHNMTMELVKDSLKRKDEQDF